MLEKLLLASILTFSFSLFADIGWSNARKEISPTPSPHHAVLILTQRSKNIDMGSNR